MKRACRVIDRRDIKETFMIPDFASRAEAVAMFRNCSGFRIPKSITSTGYTCKTTDGFVNDVCIEHGCIEIGM
jgi:hypothetical protein